MEAQDLTQRRYTLRCKTKFFRKTVVDQLPNGQTRSYERCLVFLVPEESDERTRFLRAWLPETSEEHFELAAHLGFPVDSPSRLSIHRADGRCDRHYLMIMSKGVEDVLVKLKEGAVLSVTTMKADEDSEADTVANPEYNYELIQ